MSIKDDLIEAFEALEQGFDTDELTGFVIVGIPALENPELEYSEIYMPADASVSLAIAGLEMVKHRLLAMCTAEAVLN